MQKIDKNTETLKALMEIIYDFPDVEDVYEYNDSIIKIENSSDEFIKRVSINSQEVNLSINILNCKSNKIEKKYFRHFNFEEYAG